MPPATAALLRRAGALTAAAAGAAGRRGKGGSGGLPLWCATPDGRQCCVDAAADATVGDVQRLVADALFGGGAAPRLSFAGARLSDPQQLLSDAGIAAEARLVADAPQPLSAARLVATGSGAAHVLVADVPDEGGTAVSISSQTAHGGVGSFTGAAVATVATAESCRWSVRVDALRGNSDDFSVGVVSGDTQRGETEDRVGLDDDEKLKALYGGMIRRVTTHRTSEMDGEPQLHVCSWLPQRESNENTQLPMPRRVPVGATIHVEYDAPKAKLTFLATKEGNELASRTVENVVPPIRPCVSVTYPACRLIVCFRD